MTSRLWIPEGPGRSAALAAGATWVGATAGLGVGWIACALGALGLAFGDRKRLMTAVLLAAAASGAMAGERVAATLGAELPQGRVEVRGEVLVDGVASQFGTRFIMRPFAIRVADVWTAWHGPPLSVIAGGVFAVEVGDGMTVEGTVRRRPGRVRGVRYAGGLVATSIEPFDLAPFPHLRLGNLLRRRVGEQLDALGPDPEVALLSGLLIGDVDALPEGELEDLRRSGLTHFVAVSGGNVALFLAGWWLAIAPLGLGVRTRAVAGLGALAVFVVATRWEPSVVRAATMAAVVLGGRIASLPIGPWTALGTAVTTLLLVSGDLSADLGFQLSALATAGVIAGSRLFAGHKPAFLWTALAATMSAQTAVLPLLLLRFGTVPLVAPLTNVVAAPLVVLATAIGGVGVLLGLDRVTALGVDAAGWVLTVARVGAGWPQLGPTGVATVVALGLIARVRALRLLVAAAGVTVLVTLLPRSAPWPDVPMASFPAIQLGKVKLGVQLRTEVPPSPLRQCRSKRRRCCPETVTHLQISN